MKQVKLPYETFTSGRSYFLLPANYGNADPLLTVNGQILDVISYEVSDGMISFAGEWDDTDIFLLIDDSASKASVESLAATIKGIKLALSTGTLTDLSPEDSNPSDTSAQFNFGTLFPSLSSYSRTNIWENNDGYTPYSTESLLWTPEDFDDPFSELIRLLRVVSVNFLPVPVG